MVSQIQIFLPVAVMYFMLKTLYIADDIAFHLKFPSSITADGWIISPSGKLLWWVPADFRGNFSGSFGTLAVWNNSHIMIFSAM
jgi:hypothetical protein